MTRLNDLQVKGGDYSRQNWDHYNLSKPVIIASTLDSTSIEKGLISSGDVSQCSAYKLRANDSTLFEGFYSSVDFTQSEWEKALWIRVFIEESNLSWLDAKGLRILGGTIRGCCLDGTNFRESEVKSALFEQCDFYHVDWSGSFLENTQFKGCSFEGVDFTNTEINLGNFIDCDFDTCLFEDTVVSKTLFQECGLAVNFGNSTIRDSEFYKCEMPSCDLTKVTLDPVTTFRGSNLQEAQIPKVTTKEEALELLAQIAQRISQQDGVLDMAQWESDCGTAQCLGGWAIVLHPEGEDLLAECHNNSEWAGLLLLGAEAHKHFWDNNEEALDWLMQYHPNW